MFWEKIEKIAWRLDEDQEAGSRLDGFITRTERISRVTSIGAFMYASGQYHANQPRHA